VKKILQESNPNHTQGLCQLSTLLGNIVQHWVVQHRDVMFWTVVRSLNTSVCAYKAVQALHFSLMLMSFFWAFISLPDDPWCTSSRMFEPPLLILLGVQDSLVFTHHIRLDWASQREIQGWGCQETGLWRSKRGLGPCPHRLHEKVGALGSSMALTLCPSQGQPFQPLIFHLKVWPHPQYWGASLPLS